MAEILENFESMIGEITLIPSDSGKFEIMVNDRLVYSKLETGRFTEPGEAVKLISKIIKDR